MKRLGAMILSGGGSRRMGADKGGLVWLGRRAVDRVAQIAREAGATPILTVSPNDYGLPQVLEEAPFSGPVGGVLAGAAALGRAGCQRALVLAVDAPTLTLDDIAPLLAAAAPGAAYSGLHLPFVLTLDAMPQEAEPGWPVGRLLEKAGLQRLPAPPGAAARLRGANDPEERDALLAELSERENAHGDGAV